MGDKSCVLPCFPQVFVCFDQKSQKHRENQTKTKNQRLGDYMRPKISFKSLFFVFFRFFWFCRGFFCFLTKSSKHLEKTKKTEKNKKNKD